MSLTNLSPSRAIITKRTALAVLLSSTFAAAAATAQPTPPAANLQQRERQTQADDYTRYELLAPDTASFRIVYEVTATTPGTRFFFNVIRKGSEASDESVFDMMTGEALKFEVVSGADARAAGLAEADLDTSYIKIHLPRPVPSNGEIRLRIDKTYKDAKSYFREGDLIVFSRSLSIKRNAVVLPAGFEIVSLNVPSQILPEADGRLAVSFLNAAPAAMPLVIKARPLGRAATSLGQPTPSAPPPAATSAGAAPGAAVAAAGPSQASRLSERAHQDREIVYFLEPPDTHRFSLYHDYTESREGMDRYLNVVRQGSTVSKPGARILDTGEELKWEIVKGDGITRARIDIGEAVRPDTEVVVVRFPPVKKGQSVRLRIEETYTDAGRYRLEGDGLVFDRSFGRPRNAVVLPAGWYLTASSIPAVVTELSDGRIRLDYINSRPDELDVLLKARQRPR
jgi:hypothetical protein